MRWLRRFVAVGTVATVIDVVGFVLLAWTTMLSFWAADLVAIGVATVFSFVGHRISGRAPQHRWYRNVGSYAAGAVVATATDVGIVLALTAGWTSRDLWPIVGAKAVALLAAGLVRAVVFRQAMFDAVRVDQQAPACRPLVQGDVRLSLVVPAYREEEGIAQTVSAIEAALGHLRHDGGFELVVVDDGSGDATAEQAEAAGADVVLRQQPNQGKGAAVRAGVLAARGRCVAFTDADLSYSPDQVLLLLDQVEAGWDVVVGSRRHTETTTLVRAGRLREVGGRVINLLTSVVLLGQYRDTQCGLKAMRRDVAEVIFGRSVINGFAFDIEVFHLVERFRLTLVEVPVEVVNSQRSTVRVARDAFRLIRDMFRIRGVGRTGGYDEPVDLPSSEVIGARLYDDRP